MTLVASPRLARSGTVLALSAFAALAVQDALMKWLVVRLPLPEIIAVRSVAILATILVTRPGRRALCELARSRQKVALLARGVILLAAWLLLFSAAAQLALADLTTIYFIAPVIAVVLSGLILKERVGPVRWTAIAIGFAGVLLAAGPMAGLSPGPVVIALLAAVCFGIGIVLMAWLGRLESSLVQILSTNGIFVAGTLLPALWMWRTPDLPEFALVLGTGLASGVGQYLLFEAFRSAPASTVAPIEYTGLIWASILGYAIWGDVPGAATIAGAVLIVLSSLILVWLESRGPQSSIDTPPPG